ncbi:sigma-54-dependent transcriptional regulator [Gemmatimonas sp.]|uniref:sigma-54-dependent transcriptional regulator n=1 Tax=Gemmatimonas sp. TaxID=1962908 RepID=UPI003F6EE1F2
MSNVALYNTEVPSAFPLARGASLTTRVPTGRDRQLRIAPEGQVSSPTPSHALMRILVVSPNAQACTALRGVFEREGREVLSASSPAGVVEMIGRAEVDLLISDQLLPDDSGYALLESVRDQHPTVMTALMAAPGMSQAPLLAFERGASDFLTQPIDAEEAVAFLRRAEQLHAVRGHVARPSTAEYEAPDFRGMYGTTSVMRDVFKMITRVGRTGVTVLVTGESGTGKELVARALHDESARRNKPFIALNCSALPSELVESELFGHTRGAFTGAVKDRGGLFEAAHDGTLFLDEIGDLGPLAQAKVLRAVESGEVMRVGGTKSSHVDVRVIAATNRPLDEMVLDGRFREDLLYRLKVISLALPPLRERKSDIPLLASHFLHVFAERHSLPARALSPDARDMLMQYDWPGNVRELRNVIEGALVMCDGAEIAVCDLPSSLTTASPRLSVPTSLMEQSADLPFVEARERALREFDRAFLGAALSRNGGKIARTARALGLHRQSLQKLLARRDLRNGETVREL